jgi:hypothetical protein
MRHDQKIYRTRPTLKQFRKTCLLRTPFKCNNHNNSDIKRTHSPWQRLAHRLTTSAAIPSMPRTTTSIARVSKWHNLALAVCHKPHTTTQRGCITHPWSTPQCIPRTPTMTTHQWASAMVKLLMECLPTSMACPTAASTQACIATLQAQ